jgi:hypothetical protein
MLQNIFFILFCDKHILLNALRIRLSFTKAVPQRAADRMCINSFQAEIVGLLHCSSLYIH